VVIYHLDTDFLIHALFAPGDERRVLREIADSDSAIEISAIAWYEFCRGPRSPEQLAVARNFLEDDGVIAFDDDLAMHAADLFRRLGSPRRRAVDLAIAAAAMARGARLLTGNTRDYSGIDGLQLGAED
jgi:predicted nucleic acid-binding protein